MKTHFITLIMAAAVICAGISVSCDGGDNPDTKDTLSVSPSSLSFGYNDTKEEAVTVETTAAKYDTDCEADWIDIVEAGGSFTVSVSEYTHDEASEVGYAARSAKITVTAGTAPAKEVTVTQAAPQEGFSVSPTSLSFEYNDTKEESVTVETTAGEYGTDCSAAWVDIDEEAGSFSVSVAAYTNQEAEAAGYAPRTATITVTSGSFAPVVVTVTQTAPGELITMTSDPEELVFELGEVMKTASIQTNANEYSVAIPAEFAWITNVSKVSNIISVTVTKHVGTEPREGHLLISAAGMDEDYRLDITQMPELPFDFAGEWTYTGQKWNGSYTAVSGNLTAVYDEQKDWYIFSDISDYGWAGDTGKGGFAIRVDDTNKVTFVQFDDKLEMYSVVTYTASTEPPYPIYWYRWSYRNYVRHINSEIAQNDIPLIEHGTAIGLAVNEDGSVVTFPATVKIGLDVYDYVFGFGGVPCEAGSDDDEWLYYNPEPINPPYAEIATDFDRLGALFNGLVLTRVE